MTEPTLDDVALHLLQLEPQDRAALRRVRERLAEGALAGHTRMAAQPYIARAVRALGPLADGTAWDAAAVMHEVGRLLQRAVEAASDAPPSAPARPAAELVEELVAAHALLAADAGYRGLMDGGGQSAERAGRLSRAVRALQCAGRDAPSDAHIRPTADLGGY